VGRGREKEVERSDEKVLGGLLGPKQAMDEGDEGFP
jgi:hypothetical protein